MKRLLLATAVLLSITSTANANFIDDIFGGENVTPTKSRYHTNIGHDDSGRISSGSKMVASYYGHGERLARHTASGAVFNPHGHTAAHKTLPFGTVLRVCHRGCVNVTINDRGPFVRGRHLDLSYGAARAIGMGSTSTVTVERLN